MCTCAYEQACIGAFAFYLLGFGFAYDGDGDANGFIGAGKSNFALSGRGYDDTERFAIRPRPFQWLLKRHLSQRKSPR